MPYIRFASSLAPPKKQKSVGGVPEQVQYLFLSDLVYFLSQKRQPNRPKQPKQATAIRHTANQPTNTQQPNARITANHTKKAIKQ